MVFSPVLKVIRQLLLLVLVSLLFQMGDEVTSCLVQSSPVQVQALLGDIVLCSRTKHFTLTVPLSAQVHKWVPVNLMLGVTLQCTRPCQRGILGRLSEFKMYRVGVLLRVHVAVGN